MPKKHGTKFGKQIEGSGISQNADLNAITLVKKETERRVEI